VEWERMKWGDEDRERGRKIDGEGKVANFEA